jgi:hypothetical protein
VSALLVVRFSCHWLHLRGMTLTVIGTSFGQSGAVVFVGINRCSPVLHDPATPQSKLTCILPSSKSKDLPVQVFQKNGELSVDPATVSYSQCPSGLFSPTLFRRTASHCLLLLV